MGRVELRSIRMQGLLEIDFLFNKLAMAGWRPMALWHAHFMCMHVAGHLRQSTTQETTHTEKKKNAHEPIPCPPPRNLVPRSLGYFFVCRPPVRVLRCVCPSQWGGDPHTRPTHSHGVMVSLSLCLLGPRFSFLFGVLYSFVFALRKSPTKKA